MGLLMREAFGQFVSQLVGWIMGLQLFLLLYNKLSVQYTVLSLSTLVIHFFFPIVSHIVSQFKDVRSMCSS